MVGERVLSGQSHTTSSRRLSGTLASLQEPVCRILKSSPVQSKKIKKIKNFTANNPQVWNHGASSRLLRQVSVCSNRTNNRCVGVQGSQCELWILDVLSVTNNNAPDALVFGLDETRADSIPHSLCVSVPPLYLRVNKHLQQL